MREFDLERAYRDAEGEVEIQSRHLLFGALGVVLGRVGQIEKALFEPRVGQAGVNRRHAGDMATARYHVATARKRVRASVDPVEVAGRVAYATFRSSGGMRSRASGAQ